MKRKDLYIFILAILHFIADKFYFFFRKRKGVLGLLGVMAIIYTFILPNPLFTDPYSNVLLDEKGQLLGARIAADGQWRFPYKDSVPTAFARALTTFEDKRFYHHPGVDPLAIGRAFLLNIQKREIVSGGSTLSMQVIRLARKGQARSISEKIIEAILATRLELRYSKVEILALYAAHAPFGGNVVGLEAAAWKYFGRSAAQLSWAEAATLAVLPNAPGLIHPGRNRNALKVKRDKLLVKLLETAAIDSFTYELALLEELPPKPLPLPMHAPHLLDRIQAGKQASLVNTTLNLNWQMRTNQIIAGHHLHLKGNGIHNAAALVVEVETGDVKAYVGNTRGNDPGKGHAVDIITAPRSTGSILKPFLYAAMLQEGSLLPKMLVADIPSYYGGYQPANYNRTYDGAVPAQRALARSLNVPAVRMLYAYGVPKFHYLLKQIGMRTLRKPPEHYGLTLILGGAEASLWDLTGMYAGMARNLENFHHYNSQYAPNSFKEPNFFQSASQGTLSYENFSQLKKQNILGAGAIWHTFESLIEVNRPEIDQNWRRFSSSQRIAWKTGTSYGYRDAWAIGCTPDYVVAVWVGNADGEGRPGIVGIEAAAPIMFDIFQAIDPPKRWFKSPYDELIKLAICRQSGHQASDICRQTDTTWVPLLGEQTQLCPYHKSINLDASAQYRLHSDCESPLNMQQKTYFVLPPSQEVYYKQKNPDYILLPPFREDCIASLSEDSNKSMEIIYPKVLSSIFVPIDLDGKPSATVFEIAHRQAATRVFWHIDDTFMGETKDIHEMAFKPTPGKHRLTLVDENGASLERVFTILAR